MYETVFDYEKNRLVIDSIRYIRKIAEQQIDFKYYVYSSDNEKKILIVTDDLSFYEYNKRFYESAHKKLRPHFVKFIDLREFENFNYANVRVTKIKKYKAAKSLGLTTKITRHIAAGGESTNGVKFDSPTLQAFDETFHNVDFFKFKEQCYEYKFLVSMVGEKGKILNRVNLNVGDLAIIYCPTFFNIEPDSEGREIRGNRCSVQFPVFQIGESEYVAEVNEGNKVYKEMIEQNRLVNEMIDL
ncbi:MULTISPECIES: hypothetical protein [Pseudomonadaceae]|uniref:hypothetical protein n=1 Tax=Pseudomonadaceae TaxID=135621 RepID=UPI001CBF9ADB|nr:MULTISPECIES: hypothetical protein [Pseudomonas]MBZ3676815.1 hypothetical protein [Pseudomonas aeruginosa]MBZ3687831.1 hypothetical protein [Pseudomonas aeruginosa]